MSDAWEVEERARLFSQADYDPRAFCEEFCHEGLHVECTTEWPATHPDLDRRTGDYYAAVCSTDAFGATEDEAVKNLAKALVGKMQREELWTGC